MEPDPPPPSDPALERIPDLTPPPALPEPAAVQRIPIGSQWKNFSLEGSGANPLIVYATVLGIVLFWLVGACVLSFLGPLGAIGLVAAIYGYAWYRGRQTRQTEIEVLPIRRPDQLP